MTKDSKPNQPKEAEVMASILKEMGVEEYEAGVVNQMLEFTYRYVTEILDDARAFANYAKKSKTIEIDDVKLAISMQVEKSVTTPPPRDLLLELGRIRNANPLPPIKSQCGIRLPPDRYCLSASNMQLKAPKKGAANRGINSIGTNIKASKSGGNKVSTIKSAATPPQKIIGVGRPLIKVTPGPPGGSAPKIQISAGPSLSSMKGTTIKTEEDSSSSFKRKREDDDYDAD